MPDDLTSLPLHIAFNELDRYIRELEHRWRIQHDGTPTDLCLPRGLHYVFSDYLRTSGSTDDGGFCPPSTFRGMRIYQTDRPGIRVGVLIA